MHPTYAYAYGALEKMAEYNVDPYTFVRAAIRTQDPVGLKIASALAALEKVALNIGSRPTHSMAQAFVPGIAPRGPEYAREMLMNRAARAAMNAPPEQTLEEAAALAAGKGPGPGIGQRIMDAAGDMGLQSGTNPWTARQTHNVLQAGPGANDVSAAALRNQNLVVGGGLTALGAGGAGVYGGMDADTYGNQAANLANEYLGTDFDTISRIGNMLG